MEGCEKIGQRSIDSLRKDAKEALKLVKKNSFPTACCESIQLTLHFLDFTSFVSKDALTMLSSLDIQPCVRARIEHWYIGLELYYDCPAMFYICFYSLTAVLHLSAGASNSNSGC